MSSRAPVVGSRPDEASAERLRPATGDRVAATAQTSISCQLVGFLVLLAIVPYLNTLTAGFTLDDLPNIRENAAVTNGIDLTEIFATPLPMLAYLYRPVTVLTFAVNEAVAPGSAGGFHAVNVLLHAAVTILVFWLAVRLFDGRVAFIAAALFAVHPLHTEAVTNIVGRAELLAALFGLLAVLSADPLGGSAGRWARRSWYGFSVLCFAVAVFSKESAVTILPLVLLYRMTRRAEPLVTGLWTEVRSLYWVPYALCFGIFLFFRFIVVGTLAGVPAGRLDPIDNFLAFIPWTARIQSALGILWDYFGLLNLPFVLSADYSYNQVPILSSWFDPRCVGGVLLCMGTAIAFLVCRPAVRFSVAIPFAALLLTANILFPIGTIKAERLLYFPSVGWVLLAALAFDRLLQVARYRFIGTAVLVLVGVAFTVRTWVRNDDWRDNFTMARSLGISAPDSAKSLSNVGVALLKQGHPEAAIQLFHASLAIHPMHESAFGLGTALNELGKPDEAVEWLREALEITPSLKKAHTDLCHVLWERGDFAAAARACRNGLRYHPADANLLKGLGSSLLGAGETEKGADILRRSVALTGDDGSRGASVASLDPAAARRNGGKELVR